MTVKHKYWMDSRLWRYLTAELAKHSTRKKSVSSFLPHQLHQQQHEPMTTRSLQFSSKENHRTWKFKLFQLCNRFAQHTDQSTVCLVADSENAERSHFDLYLPHHVRLRAIHDQNVRLFEHSFAGLQLFRHAASEKWSALLYGLCKAQILQIPHHNQRPHTGRFLRPILRRAQLSATSERRSWSRTLDKDRV